MTNRTARIAALAAIIAATIMMGFLMISLADLATKIATDLPAETIMEDDPRWDCATMGNRVCGPN